MNPDTKDLPPVFFNHLYVVLSDKTYRAIQASDFLRVAFPGRERRTTVTAAGESWSGTYFYGRDNYLEFFGETAGRFWKPDVQEGWAGLAFSTDQPGGAAAVRSRIENALGYIPYHELRQLQTSGQNVNWFHQVRLAEKVGLESFDAWVMEYHPDIFALKGIDLPPGGHPTRQAYLSPWNKDGSKAESSSPGKEPRQPGPVFKRLSGATFQMETARARAFSQVMQVLGYQLTEETGQMTLEAHGFALTLRVQSEEAAPPGYRLVSLRLEMERRSVAPMTFVFAPGSRLVLSENLTAEWFFCK
jgi:hypothetical protein